MIRSIFQTVNKDISFPVLVKESGLL